ncbi:Zinc knuckle [Trichostrongylus colubriformis]|uniref:Zinc knuckle n=1 Tax=Trichostrongylus colubriformis TaxID=6319 RepID=A0AAN8ILA9_TRICO
MTSVGYLKGQITKTTKALEETNLLAQDILAEKVAEEERTRGKIDTSTERTRQYMEVLNKLQQQSGNLLNDWKRAESYANKKEDEEESSSILQGFQEHWEATNCESQLTVARINISFMEKAVEEVQAVLAKQQQRREEAEHPAPIPSHLIQTPKLELPNFAGDITLFPEFWEIFAAAIHNHPYMTDATKLIYLKRALQGDAKDVVASVQVGDDNYSKAVELLQNTYNRPELLRNRLVDQLESLPPATESPLVQRTTLCKVKAIWVQLSSLNEQPGSTMTMKTIRSKFPQKTREKVGELRKRNDNWNTEDLLSALDRVIDQFELMEDTDPTSINASRKAESRSTRSLTPPARTYKTRKDEKKRNASPRSSRDSQRRHSNSRRCRLCLRGGHDPTECEEIPSPHERRRIVTEQKLCWKCLQKGHQQSYCDAPLCRKCGRNHHTALCFQRDRPRSPSRSNSPRPRYRQRRDSAESYSSTNNYKNRNRVASRSPSPDRRARPSTRTPRGYRHGSPHPKVGFRRGDTRYTYNSHSRSPARSTTDSSQTDSELETTSESYYKRELNVNTTQISKTASNNQKETITRKVSNTQNIPRLMVVKAATTNRITKKKQTLTVLLDSGSECSYIKLATAQSLGLKLKHPTSMTTITVGGHSHTEQSYSVKIILRNRQNGQPTKLHLWTKRYITKVPTIGGANDEKHVVDNEGYEEIDILIGMDHYWGVVEFNPSYQLPSGLVKSFTKLGPVLSGQKSSSTTRSYSTSETIESEENNTNRMINDLFGLEAIGTKDDADDSKNSIIQHYYDTQLDILEEQTGVCRKGYHSKVGADGSRTGSKASSLHTETAEYRVRVRTHPI